MIVVTAYDPDAGPDTEGGRQVLRDHDGAKAVLTATVKHLTSDRVRRVEERLVHGDPAQASDGSRSGWCTVILRRHRGLLDPEPTAHDVAADVEAEDLAGALPASAGSAASLIPPALPRPPVSTWALTTTGPPSGLLGRRARLLGGRREPAVGGRGSRPAGRAPCPGTRRGPRAAGRRLGEREGGAAGGRACATMRGVRRPLAVLGLALATGAARLRAAASSSGEPAARDPGAASDGDARTGSSGSPAEGPALVFRTHTFAVTEDGWKAELAIENMTCR